MSQTTEQIDALKQSWMKDPCWDIEDTPGFEDHQAELLAFRKETEAQWKAAAEAELNTKAAEMGVPKVLAQSLSSFQQIERELSGLDLFMEGMSYSDVIAREQVRATLLLAAQVKRLGNLLEEKIEEDLDARSRDFMTKLYKTE
jgi:hypothetical protein